MNEDVAILYRPPGPKEIELVKQSGFRGWPPRLPEQPIFYTVSNEEYALQMAARWNVADNVASFVTHFSVRNASIDRHEVYQVGGSIHIDW